MREDVAPSLSLYSYMYIIAHKKSNCNRFWKKYFYFLYYYCVIYLTATVFALAMQG